ncbi:MAG: hypothetical protein J5854_03210 [Clostridia bacterium]|nr:hypothetical protein [Clostridia bacterium]
MEAGTVKQGGLTIRRTAHEIKVFRTAKKLVPLGCGLAALVLIVGYVISVLYMRFGAFTVMINKYDQLDYALALSESSSFNTYTAHLNADIDEKITNISVDWLPAWLDNVDGEHNGDNYVAYTFYCKNMGVNPVDYTYELYIANMSLEVERAVRIRLYVNGEYVDYAYARTDGGEGPEPGTTMFQSGNTVVKNIIRDFKPGDITKYTVVIWLEGDDPECVDKILGGQLKVDMAMSIVREEDETPRT